LKNDSVATASSSSTSIATTEQPRTICADENNISNDESGNITVQSNVGKVELTSGQVLVLQSITELTMEEARKEFLCTLFAAFPYWKYDNFL
jgi:hypothetical protein